MHRYKFLIAYDGTHYFGWQKTKEGPSIQQTLAQALSRLDPDSPLPEGASRTDKGVHAEGQIASTLLKKEWKPTQLSKALNAHLPADIRILSTEQTPIDFHPTLDAHAKEYKYQICLSPVQDPTYRLYSWALRAPSLSIDAMKRAAFALLGTHDFTSFANEHKLLKQCIRTCTIHAISIRPLPEQRLEIRMKANRFLYKMARNIAGTLLYVGVGKIPAEHIPLLLSSKDRKQAGITAPAHGLTLSQVQYN